MFAKRSLPAMSLARPARPGSPARAAPRCAAAFLLALGIVTSALLVVNPRPAPAQAGFAQQGPGGLSLPGTLFAPQPELFANDGRIRLLALALNPSGLTESATEQIGLILQKDLVNTGHFDVVGPREVNAAFEQNNPDLVDCRNIACGVESGKILGAQRVLVGALVFDDPTFVLRVRLIDPANNLTDYHEEVRFTDENMEEVLFRLANTLSENQLLVGRVLSTSIRGIVISLGRTHGIELSDHLVIYKQEVPITDLQGEQVDVQRKNVAIARVLNVNENSSEAIIVHKTEDPQVGQYAQTYLDANRQIELVEHTRKELDTGIRLANRIRPLELEPVLLADSERREWEEALNKAEAGKDLWFTVGAAAGVATLIVLNDFDNDTNGRIQLGLGGGLAVYSFFQWNKFRNEIDELMTEGRAKGYVNNLRLDPVLGPGHVGVRLAWRF